METIRQKVFTGWYFMRWLRLGFGVFFMIQAIQMHNTSIGLIAGFFLMTAILNTGCCGAGSCPAPMKKNSKDESNDINFEEITN